MSFSFPAGRVQLRNLKPTDLPEFAAYRADPVVVRYQGFDVYTEAQAAAFIESQLAAPVPAEPGGWVQLAIARTDDDQLLGD